MLNSIPGGVDPKKAIGAPARFLNNYEPAFIEYKEEAIAILRSSAMLTGGAKVVVRIDELKEKKEFFQNRQKEIRAKTETLSKIIEISEFTDNKLPNGRTSELRKLHQEALAFHDALNREWLKQNPEEAKKEAALDAMMKERLNIED